MKPSLERLLRYVYLAAIVIALCGCKGMRQRRTATSIPMTADQVAAVKQGTTRLASGPNGMPNSAAKTYTVEFRSASGSKDRVTLPYKPNMVISDALHESGAHRRFSGMKIRLKRATKDPLRYIPLDVEFNNSHARIEPMFDYAIYPRDYIVVLQDDTTPIDTAISDALTPFGHLLGQP